MSSPRNDKPRGFFVDTPWPLLQEASQSPSSAESRAALERICLVYWPCFHNYIRARGYSFCDAQDLTQSFIVHLLGADTFLRANPVRGRLRSYLCAALQHFLADQTRRASAQKRGGAVEHEPLSEEVIRRLPAPPVREEKPDEKEESEAAAALFRHVWGRLEERYAESSKLRILHYLMEAFPGSEDSSGFSAGELARRLGRPAASVRKDLSRLREDFRRLVLEELARRAPGQNVAEEFRRFRVIVARDLPWPEVEGGIDPAPHLAHRPDGTASASSVYETRIVAGSPQPPGPPEPTARTRTQ